MQSSRVLVVAPDADLRDSLCFALGTHGCAVSSLGAFDSDYDVSDFDCIVVHEKALTEHVSLPYKEYVLLLSYAPEQPEHIGMNVLRMPILGNELIESVSQLIADRRRSRHR